MDLIDELRQFATRASKMKDAIATEEATKNSLILPFFQLLGYDVFNPFEFVPEYTAAIGDGNKSEKVDYTIVIEGKPVIAIEAKHHSEPLDKHVTQLFKYFVATSAKFGILTNGLNYMFYTDLNEPNKMDLEPFLCVDILNLHENAIPELKRFAKKTLDIDGAFSAAAELKYMGKINTLLDTLRTDPAESFVKYIMSEIYEGVKNTKAINSFRPIIKRGFNQYINDCIGERLKVAMEKRPENDRAEAEQISDGEASESDVYDTSPMSVEEMEAFAIVKAILHDLVDVDRLTWQHTTRYMVILFDNNSRKRLCRFWFKGSQKYITTPDENMKPVRRDIEGLNDIYKYADYIKEVCQRYV